MINLAKVYISTVYEGELFNDNDHEYDVNLVNDIWYVYVRMVAKKREKDCCK